MVAENRLDEAAIDIRALLEKGYTYLVDVTGSQTEVGESACTIISFTLFDPDGNDVTEMYDIEYMEGTLRVKDAKRITVTLYSLEKEYDGEYLEFLPHQYYNMTGISLEEYDVELSIRGGLNVAGTIQLKDVEYTLKITRKSDGVDVTNEYYVSFEGDPLTITKRIITLTAASETAIYTGNTLTNNKVYISQGVSLLEGHTLTAYASGSINHVGSVENAIDPASIKVFDRDGNDVTDNYDFTLISGTLTLIEDK